MPIRGYQFQGYLDDDAQMIYELLKDNWVNKGELQDKTIFFYNEIEDPAQFDFKTGEIAIRVYADEIISDPRGIGFDSETSSRAIRIDIRGIDRELILQCQDEIRQVLQQFRLRPGNMWQTLQFASHTPVYPSYKFFHSISTFTLRKYYNMLPNINHCGHERY